MQCSCNYHPGSAVKNLWRKKKGPGLFICMTAVYSGELGPLSLQLCRVTKVRNSNLCNFQTVQIVLESQTEETLAQCFCCESKLVMGDFVLRKEVKEANLLPFCSHHTRLEALDMIILRKLRKDIYVQSDHVIKCSERLSASFQTAASSQVTPEFPPRSPGLHPCESKMQSEQGEAGGRAAMLLSTQLAYHRGL